MHSLSINKRHVYDDISIGLLKMCETSIVRLCQCFSRTVCKNSSFPNN